MAGFLSGFQQGWGMADRELQQQEEQRRYDAGVEREQARYNTQQARLDRQENRQIQQDARAQQQFDMQVEQNEYNKTLRPMKEEQTKLSLESSRLANEQVRKENQLKDIQTVGERLQWEKANNGDYSEETLQSYLNVTAGTALDPKFALNKEYIKSLDFIDKTIKTNPQAINSPEFLKAYNTVYEDRINAGDMEEGGARKELTGINVDENNNLSFSVTTFDANNQPMKTSPMTEGRGTEGKPLLVPLDDAVNHLRAKQMGVMTLITNPELRTRLEGSINTAAPIGAAEQTPQQKFAVEQLQGAIDGLNSTMNPVDATGMAGAVDQNAVDVARERITQMIMANPYLAEFAPQYAPITDGQKQQYLALIERMQPRNVGGVNDQLPEDTMAAIRHTITKPTATIDQIEKEIRDHLVPSSSPQNTQQNDSILQSIINSPNQSPAEKAGQIYQSLGIMNNQANAMSARAQQ